MHLRVYGLLGMHGLFVVVKSRVFIGMFSLLLTQEFRKPNIKFKFVSGFVVEAIF